MAARELTVVILNHTNEELQLEPNSPQLDHGKQLNPESPPPPYILAGESVIWSFKSTHIGAGIQGHVTYRMVGFEEDALVTFSWNVHVVSANKFCHSTTLEGFTTRVFGGAGKQGVAVFIFEPIKRIEIEDYCDR
ncbi:hypothetical protein V2G26_018846 [Clonostachys chloroleuca]